MKKIFVIVCLSVVGLTVNAQLYLGGSAGFNIETTIYDNDRDARTNLTLSVYPEIGYFLSSKFSVGAELGFSIKSDSDYDDTTFDVCFVPYVRYALLQLGKFDVIAKASLNTELKKDYTYIGLHIDPILAYNLSDKFILQANLKFLSFRTYFSGYKDSYSDIGFGFGVNANNLATLGALQVGFLYKF